MKAILVIDTPNNCSECPCCNGNECGNEHKGYVDGHLEWNSGRPSWCQLKPMPEKIETPKIIQEQIDGWFKLAGEYIGYNRCIDEILGEEECGVKFVTK